MKNKLALTYSGLRVLQEEIEKIAKSSNIACKKGCCHCCKQIVVIYDFEKPFIKEAIKKLKPGIKEQVKQSYLQSKEHLSAYMGTRNQISFDEYVTTYNKLFVEHEIPCPFLINDLCAIYKERPIGCQWHMVEDEPELCKKNPLRDATQESLQLQYNFGKYLLKLGRFGFQSLFMGLDEVFGKNKSTRMIASDKHDISKKT